MMASNTYRLLLLIFIISKFTLNYCEGHNDDTLQGSLTRDTLNRFARALQPLKKKQNTDKREASIKSLVLADTKRSAPVNLSKDPLQKKINLHVKRCFGGVVKAIENMFDDDDDDDRPRHRHRPAKGYRPPPPQACNPAIYNVINSGCPPAQAYPPPPPQAYSPPIYNVINNNFRGACMDVCRSMRRSMMPNVLPRRKKNKNRWGPPQGQSYDDESPDIVNRHAETIALDISVHVKKHIPLNSVKSSGGGGDINDKLQLLDKKLQDNIKKAIVSAVKDTLGDTSDRIVTIREKNRRRSAGIGNALMADPIGDNVKNKAFVCVRDIGQGCSGFLPKNNSFVNIISPVVDEHMCGAVKRLMKGLSEKAYSKVDKTAKKRRIDIDKTAEETVQEAVDKDVNTCTDKVLSKALEFTTRNKSKEEIKEVDNLIRLLILENTLDAARRILINLEKIMEVGMHLSKKQLTDEIRDAKKYEDSAGNEWTEDLKNDKNKNKGKGKAKKSNDRSRKQKKLSNKQKPVRRMGVYRPMRNIGHIKRKKNGEEIAYVAESLV